MRGVSNTAVMSVIYSSVLYRADEWSCDILRSLKKRHYHSLSLKVLLKAFKHISSRQQYALENHILILLFYN